MLSTYVRIYARQLAVSPAPLFVALRVYILLIYLTAVFYLFQCVFVVYYVFPHIASGIGNGVLHYFITTTTTTTTTNNLCERPPQYAPAPVTLTFWPWK